MTPDDLRAEQKRLGLNHNQMYALLKVCRATYYNWRAGKTSVPHWVAVVLKNEIASSAATVYTTDGLVTLQQEQSERQTPGVTEYLE